MSGQAAASKVKMQLLAAGISLMPQLVGISELRVGIAEPADGRSEPADERSEHRGGGRGDIQAGFQSSPFRFCRTPSAERRTPDDLWFQISHSTAASPAPVRCGACY